MYLLLPHVYVCTVSDGAIFLDLKRDKYFGVGQAEASSLSTVVRGWSSPGQLPGRTNTVSLEHAMSIADKLVEGELLTLDPSKGKEASPVVLPAARTALAHEELDVRPRIRARHVLNFLAAAASASIQLRWRPLERIVEHVSTRKSRRHCTREFDFKLVRDLVAVFQRLRPFVFTSRNACLFESLVLIEFLNRYRFHPTWVFGVNTGPFSAHCWVQQNDVSLNCDLESVREYSPIFTV